MCVPMHASLWVSVCVCAVYVIHVVYVLSVMFYTMNVLKGCICFYTYRHLYACVRTYIRTWVHMLVCARVYVCTYMRTHAYILLINKYTHTVCVYRQTEKDRCTDRLTCCLAGWHTYPHTRIVQTHIHWHALHADMRMHHMHTHMYIHTHTKDIITCRSPHTHTVTYWHCLIAYILTDVYVDDTGYKGT